SNASTILFVVSASVFIIKQKLIILIVLIYYFLIMSFLACCFKKDNDCAFSFNYELYFRMFFLTFSVCEGALGLSILVSIIRRYGTNFSLSVA
ncbi:hypothetical protein L9F63_018096, partial [Diploptera punctata]